jgi:hypothetical protein
MPTPVDFSDLVGPPTSNASPSVAFAPAANSSTPNNPRDKNIPVDSINSDDDLPAGGGAPVANGSTNSGTDFSDLVGPSSPPNTVGKPVNMQQALEQTVADDNSDDGLSLAPDINRYVNSFPADQRRLVAQKGLMDTLGVAVGAAQTAIMGPEVAGTFMSDIKSIPVKQILKGIGLPSIEEGAGWAAKKVLHAAGISSFDGMIDKAVLLTQLASPGPIAKAAGGINALSQINDAIKEDKASKAPDDYTNTPQGSPGGSMDNVQPDPAMVGQGYTSGIGAGYGPSTGFQGQQYAQPSGTGIYIPH